MKIGGNGYGLAVYLRNDNSIQYGFSSGNSVTFARGQWHLKHNYGKMETIDSKMAVELIKTFRSIKY